MSQARAARPQPPEPKQDRSQATRRLLLDAAVDELVERGYANLTTSSVAHRAGVSRGAQQHHFPHKATLVTEAVHHLGERHMQQVRDLLAAAPSGRERVPRGLDVLFEQYRSRLFAAIVELSLAARGAPELRDAVADTERRLTRFIAETAARIVPDDVRASEGFAERWALALSAIRGLALMSILGRPEGTVSRQWSPMRRELTALLIARG